MFKFVCLLSLLMLAVVQGSKLELPSFVTEGDHIKIECKLGHDDDIPVEHIRWYKDHELFYTYSNNESRAIEHVRGISVNLDETRPHKVVLDNVTKESSGFYLCEMKTYHGVVKMGGTVWVTSKKSYMS